MPGKGTLAISSQSCPTGLCNSLCELAGFDPPNESLVSSMEIVLWLPEACGYGQQGTRLKEDQDMRSVSSVALQAPGERLHGLPRTLGTLLVRVQSES